VDKREWKKLQDLVRNAAGTRVVLKMTDDGRKMQEIQVTGLDGETLDQVERFQNYGFSSVPKGGEGLGIPVGGDRGHLAIVALDDRDSRKKGLAAGEVAVYHANGDFLHFQEGNKSELKTKESTVNADDKSTVNTKAFEANASSTAQINAGGAAGVKAPQIGLAGALSVTGQDGQSPTLCRIKGDVYIEGRLEVTGNIVVGGSVTAGGDVTAGGVSLKNHVHPGCQGGQTGPPVATAGA
jgi:phage baseplate assembly protein V